MLSFILSHHDTGVTMFQGTLVDTRMGKMILAILLGVVSINSPNGAVSAQEVRPGKAIDHKPFFPERWKEHKASTRMYPWEGKKVVLLTTTPDLDPRVMARFLERLDAGW